MKNFVKIVPIIALLSITACDKNQKADQLVVEENNVQATAEAPALGEMAPTAQANPLTTVALSESIFEFGKIQKGDQKEHTYEITNTGTNPLIISEVKPGCGCTVPDFTKEPILPGQKGKITLKFDSSNFDGIVNKQAEIFANVEKSPMVISFSADIQAK